MPTRKLCALSTLVIFGISFSCSGVKLAFAQTGVITPEGPNLVTVGENFTVSVNAAGIPAAWGWQVKLQWNPAMIEIVEVVEGDFLKQLGFTDNTFIDYRNSTGGWLLSGVYYQNFSLQNLLGEGTLVNVTFHCSGPGLSYIQVVRAQVFGRPESIPWNGYGDANDDGIINVFDNSIVAKAYGSSIGESNFYPQADFNNDTHVDMFDMLCASLNFGAHIPDWVWVVLSVTDVDMGTCAVQAGVATPVGQDVTVSPSDNTNVTFTQVTAAGVSTQNIIQPPSNEFVSVCCSEIKTTATYSGDITLQFEYNGTGLSLQDEQSMSIWLWNENSSMWADVTTSVDTDNNLVRGTSSHLSIFGVTCNLALGGSVIAEGQTTVATPPSPPPCLAAMKYLDIRSSTVFSGDIIVRLAYDDSGLTPLEESYIRLWVWDEPSRAWTDITSGLDTSANVIEGITPHLSIFGVTSYLQVPSVISVSDITCSKAVVCVGYPANLEVSFVAKNNGVSTETFDFNVRLDLQIVATLHVSNLGPGNEEVLSFTCSTAGLAIGEHAIGIIPQALVWIEVTSNGDINGDGTVNILDIVKIAIKFGMTYPNVGWDFDADINNDGRINIIDLVVVAINLGKVG